MSGTANVTQLIQQALEDVQSLARSTQVVSENLVDLASSARSTQVVSENLVDLSSRARSTQIVLLALIFRKYPLMVAYFPTLKGLGYSVIKRPKFSTNIGTHVSGREVRLAMWNYPMWEWDLTWEFLPDSESQFSGSTLSDIRTLIGFYLLQQGPLTTFCFQDPDDYAVVGNQIGTGDGTTTTFTLIRFYGSGSDVGSEPIGYLNTTQTFNVYVNGVLKTLNTDYTISQSNFYDQTITFATAPGSGLAVTVDMYFYYAVRFKDDSNDYEKFAYALWQQKKITLMSVRQ